MSDDDFVTFAVLQPDGTETNVRKVKRSDILACPRVILVADHYRDDGSCRCDDPTHTHMAEWGYRWNADKGQWV